jgi:hypothetical protein
MVGDAHIATPNMPTTAQSVEVVSSSADDDTGGAGAETVIIEGLDANFDFQTEEITLNGTTAVAASNTYIRVFRAYVGDVLTYRGNNTGAIIVRIASAGAKFCEIAATMGQTRQTGYCVPAGCELHIHDTHFHVDATKKITFHLWCAENADDVVTPFTGGKRNVHTYTGVEGSADISYIPSLVFPEKTDIWVDAETTSGTAECSAEWNGTLHS